MKNKCDKNKKAYRSAEDIDFILGTMFMFFGYSLTSQLFGTIACALSAIHSILLANNCRKELPMLILNAVTALAVVVAMCAHLLV